MGMHIQDYILLICKRSGLDVKSNVELAKMDLLLHKCSGGHRINRIRKVICIHNDGVLTYQVQRKAESLYFAWINVWKRPPLEGIAKNNLDGINAHSDGRLGEHTTAAILEATSGLTLASPRLNEAISSVDTRK